MSTEADREWALTRLDGLAASGRPLDYDDWHKVYRPMLTGAPTILDTLAIERARGGEDR